MLFFEKSFQHATNSNKIVHITLLSYICICSAHYTNKWSVKINGGKEKAQSISQKHGFILVEEIVPGIYEIEHSKVKKSSLSPSYHHHQRLEDEQDVIWHEQQTSLKRNKRDFFEDPYWPKQWYMHSGKYGGMEILPVYQKYRLSGKGVVVSILDDGIEFNHTDLFPNYDPAASYDLNDKDADPTPRYEFTNFNNHGTRCAGEVSAVANNSKCGVGIAYNAKIGGIRMLDGRITDTLEARSLFFQTQHIDIYSSSWGPTDNGEKLEGPGRVSQKAMFLGVTKGRKGLGSIYVWASGNGGQKEDSCNCDGYASNVFTISIAAVDSEGSIPSYGEKCTSTLASTYSSGSYMLQNVVTTDLYNKCTEQHSGTSASAPMAAAVFALALEANPKLTWRDLKHLVVMTSHKSNLQDRNWRKNGVGRWISDHFGYGLLNAEKLVKLAKDWVTVPKQVICVREKEFQPMDFEKNSQISIDLTIENCERSNLTLDLYRYHSKKRSLNITVDEWISDEKEDKKSVRYVESVQALVTLKSTNRGQVEIFLVSPQGTVSQLLHERQKDISDEGFTEWPFTTVQSWGERSEGLWKLIVSSQNCTGTLYGLKLVLYGTEEDPLKDQIYPPRKLNPTEKSCSEQEYFLNGSCFSSCPSTHFQSVALLSVAFKTDALLHTNESDQLENDFGFISMENDQKLTRTKRHGKSHSFNSERIMKPEQQKNSEREILKTSICFPCHTDCLKCRGSLETDCLACYPGYFMAINKKCVLDIGMKKYFLSGFYVIVEILFLLLFIVLIVAFVCLLMYCKSKSNGYTKIERVDGFIVDS